MQMPTSRRKAACKRAALCSTAAAADAVADVDDADDLERLESMEATSSLSMEVPTNLRRLGSDAGVDVDAAAAELDDAW